MANTSYIYGILMNILNSKAAGWLHIWLPDGNSICQLCIDNGNKPYLSLLAATRPISLSSTILVNLVINSSDSKIKTNKMIHKNLQWAARTELFERHHNCMERRTLATIAPLHKWINGLPSAISVYSFLQHHILLNCIMLNGIVLNLHLPIGPSIRATTVMRLLRSTMRARKG